MRLPTKELLEIRRELGATASAGAGAGAVVADAVVADAVVADAGEEDSGAKQAESVESKLLKFLIQIKQSGLLPYGVGLGTVCVYFFVAIRPVSETEASLNALRAGVFVMSLVLGVAYKIYTNICAAEERKVNIFVEGDAELARVAPPAILPLPIIKPVDNIAIYMGSAVLGSLFPQLVSKHPIFETSIKYCSNKHKDLTRFFMKSSLSQKNLFSVYVACVGLLLAVITRHPSLKFLNLFANIFSYAPFAIGLNLAGAFMTNAKALPATAENNSPLTHLKNPRVLMEGIRWGSILLSSPTVSAGVIVQYGLSHLMTHNKDLAKQLQENKLHPMYYAYALQGISVLLIAISSNILQLGWCIALGPILKFGVSILFSGLLRDINAAFSGAPSPAP